MGDEVFLTNTTAIDDKNSHANSCNLGCAAQSLSRIDDCSKWLKLHGVHTLEKVYIKEKLMKGLLIVIPAATLILIILLIVKRKKEAMYKERRKFWLQEMRKIIQQDSSLNSLLDFWGSLVMQRQFKTHHKQPKTDAYHRRTRRPTNTMLSKPTKKQGSKFLSPNSQNLYALRSTRDSRTRKVISFV